MLTAIFTSTTTIISKMGLNNVNINPKDLAHIEAIILSMTPYERKHPEILKAKLISSGIS